MKVAIVRGSYFNQYEMQNYEPLAKKHQLVGFSGLKTIHSKYKFPLTRLPSPVDLPNFPYKMPILNRLCLGDAMYLLGLEEKLKGFDIVHTRETYFYFTQQALNAKKRGYVKKVVCTCSETIPFNHEGIWNRRQFKKRAIREVDWFHCLTNKARLCLIKEGCNPDKIIVFPYGIDQTRIKVRKLKRLNRKYLRLLFVSRLVKEKGVFDLLKIAIKIVKSNFKIKCTIIGDGGEKENLINLINQSNLAKFITIKQVSYKHIFRLYGESDIFVHLPLTTKHWEEYLGMSVIEAMSSGLPIVSYRSGVIAEIVNKAGILIEPGKWQEAYLAIKKLYKQSKLRNKLGLDANKRAQALFDSNNVAKNIEKLWFRTLRF